MRLTRPGTTAWPSVVPPGFGFGVPAMYGVNVARQMRAVVFVGFVKTPFTSKNAKRSCAPAGVPIGPARQSWVLAEANAASGPDVTGST